jgi:uncharacterized protein YhbP (UPF0306 family)
MADDQELKKLAVALVHQQSTMTLATAGDNAAWAAPVYYVFYKGSFFFFSDPESRHIREALANDQAASVIYPVADTWQGIRGIQMSGRIRAVGASFTGIQAVRAYIEKFPFTKDFFEPGQALDLANFGKRFRVKLYRFDPHLVFYLDNQIRFGFREEIRL